MRRLLTVLFAVGVAACGIESPSVTGDAMTSPDAFQFPPCEATGGTPAMLTSVINQPSGLMFGDGYVYFSDRYQTAAGGAGRIFRVPRAGGVRQTLLSRSPTRGLEGVELLGVDSANVYWFESVRKVSSTGTIYRMPVGGGTPVVVASRDSMSKPVLDDTYAYYAYDASGRGKRVARVPLGGGASETIPGIVSSPLLAVDDAFLYGGGLANDATVWKMPKAGGEPVVLASNADLFALVVDGGDIFFTGTDPDGGQDLWRMSSSGAELQPLVEIPDRTVLFASLGGVGKDVYWMQLGPELGEARIRRVPRDGSTGAVDVLCEGDLNGIMAVDGDEVFWFSASFLMSARTTAP